MAKTKIMICEDEVIIGHELRENLESLGYQVVGPVTTGEKAVERALTEKPQVVLMDVRLAGRLDGISAADVIRRNAGPPVIFLTAFSDKELVERAKEVEPFGYLLKPFKERELGAAIEIALYKAATEAECAKARKGIGPWSRTRPNWSAG